MRYKKWISSDRDETHTHTDSHAADRPPHTHPCPAAREQCFGKQAWMFHRTSEPDTSSHRGFRCWTPPVCMSLLPGKEKLLLRGVSLFDCHVFDLKLIRFSDPFAVSPTPKKPSKPQDEFSWKAEVGYSLERRIHARQNLHPSALYHPHHMPFCHPWSRSLAPFPDRKKTHPPPQFPGRRGLGTGLEGRCRGRR